MKKPTVKELSIRIRTTLSCAELKRRWGVSEVGEELMYAITKLPFVAVDPDAKVTRKLKVTDLGER
jgi:hypothetical protein